MDALKELAELKEGDAGGDDRELEAAGRMGADLGCVGGRLEYLMSL